MELTTEQTEALPFPKGCPVWYNFPSISSSEPILLKQGVVQSVSFNIVTKDLMYKIVYKDYEKDIVEEVTQDKLGYAAGCKVIVASDKDGSDVEGKVLLCEPSSIGLVYTIQTSVEGFQANYEAGVEAKRVKFRKAKTVDTTTDDNKGDGVAAKEKDTAKSVPAVPLSITCDSNNSKDGTTLSASTTPTSKRASQPQHVNTNTRTTGGYNATQDSRRSITSTSSASRKENHQTKIVINIPLWLQNDPESKKSLFFHLLGSKRSSKRGVSDIGRETNCGVQINFNPDLHQHQPPITITLDACNARTAQSDQLNARTKIEDLLLGYENLRYDGAKERLLYETAICCNGPHRPHHSKSRAVKVRDPFGKLSFVTVLEIPFEIYQGRVKYHVSYLLNSFVTERIQNQDCCIELCGSGNEYDINTQKCDPFVLVIGRKWQGVDHAAEIVKQAIGRHMDNCLCSFGR